MERAKTYADLFERLGLTELSVKDGNWELCLKKEIKVQEQMFDSVTTQPQAPGVSQTLSAEEPKKEALAIKAPLTGVFYASENPEADPFVKIGDIIKPGELVCTIETMKMFNDVMAETGGKIVEICVENGQLVEFNQPLFLLEQV